MNKKVFISGCFDMLHSGHIAFINEAASYGDVHIGIGSDKTIYKLKGRKTIYTESERLYMLKALKNVSDVTINSGSGVMDFLPDLMKIKPNIIFINEDGHSPEKEKICKEYGIQYIISERIPAPGLPSRSTTTLRQKCQIPYRLDLAGGWLDQPFVSKYHPGPVITISIEPDHHFNDRSGMSTSTRKKAIELWLNDIPCGDPEKLAKILFCYENPPGSSYISGSQDSIGIVFPGINYLYYEKEHYWPSEIISSLRPDIITWLETHICLLPISPRESEFDVLLNIDISTEKAKNLAIAAEELWKAIQRCDLERFGAALTDSFEAQVRMFPNMSNEFIRNLIESQRNSALGWKLSGAGGGGYLILATDKEIPNSLKIRIRRS